MMKYIDNRLNGITMYRLVLYYLIATFGVAVATSAAGLLSLDPFSLLFSLALLLAVCLLTNRLFAWVYRVPVNVESAYISALILALIITPPQASQDYWFLIWAGVLSMASKYIVTYKGQHIFNPIGLAVAVTYFTINGSASWWVGSGILLPVTIAGGLLVIRKLGRFELVLTFLASALAFTFLASLRSSTNFISDLQNTIVLSPILFFASVILTEPMTMPPTQRLRKYYGILLGFLFTPQLHFGSLYVTPELAIVIANIFSFAVSRKEKLLLRLKDKTRIAADTYEFTFGLPHRLAFAPGQYMEWTLGHPNTDSRGNRRYFTMASSPSENVLRLGVKFYENSSTYKQNMLAMTRGDEIVASQIDGDFVLPKDPRQKLVFIAGGIGITPFRSMLKYLLDTRQQRSITVFYAVRSMDEVAYKDVLDRAEKELGIRTIYGISGSANETIIGARHIDVNVIRNNVPEYGNCIFYLSGSRKFVDGFVNTLRGMGLPNSQIKTDYFAGLT